MYEKLKEYIRKQKEREWLVEEYLTNKMLKRSRRKDETNKSI